ncbi:interleukin-1 receptor type 1-like [Hemicordylus capensis]|uniref:interleukin-1 receptor type 1-like n=1 Tax=Hemicordylus capensis TaxID=884348 RepID=UPI002302BD22|nr:interleukin-1 receptor type 1-like [Hemicordylus capensis]XP_053166054.1 interleukin-1 receptor type 1-like [Hemicordylus capensis]XP_053166055.1 interleukin-1 receptor type 1-like [Hemicordylus capensis]XP_053166057.1 interleukin-1 receptor type 1-like [Hemicordylus capensis]
MRATALFSCSLTTVILTSIKTDPSKSLNRTTELAHFIHEGEPFAVDCLLGKKLNFKLLEYSVTWYRAGNHTPVFKDQRSRIQQRENSILFLPAVLEDSGDYECIVRNSTHLIKRRFNITVFQNSNGSCFNESFAVQQIAFTLSSAKLVCPNLYYFRADTHLLWYKDCKMIQDKRFRPSSNYLVITNTTMQDRGRYTCKMPYYIMGKEYNISRYINLVVIESPPKTPPKIFFPRNHSIEVELGSSIIVDCNASGAEIYHVYWQVNNSYISNSPYRNNVVEVFEKVTLLEGQPFCTVRLNISKVSYKEYENSFVCHALNSFGQVAAHVMLRPKVPNVQGPLIGVLVTTFLLTTVTILIYNFFKIDIVLWYRNSYCPLISKKVSDGKTYDAYVLTLTAHRMGHIYHLDNFVLKLLPEVLERQCGYHLFVVGRDDLPGQAVVSVTDDTIKQSRRLMIILEPELSSCSRLEETSEQQIAVYDALIRYGIKVILIEMDRIQDYTNMPESIKYIKQKHGAIRWKGEFSRKSQLANTKFWKNVRYQMPSRRSVTLPEFHLLPQMHSS